MNGKSKALPPPSGPIQRRQRFLDAIERGATVAQAATAAGVARTTPYKWALENANFKRDWNELRGTRLLSLQDTAYELAMDGDVQLIKFLITRWEARETAGTQQATPHQVRIEIVTRGDADDTAPTRPFIETINNH